MAAHDIAVCSTIHPGVLPYLRPWAESLAAQTDPGFDLWVAADGVADGDLAVLAENGLKVEAVRPTAGSTPAEVRSELFAAVTGDYELVVAVDADDVMAPERVAAARRSMAAADLCACAMDLIDGEGRLLRPGFCALDDASPGALGALLPRGNVFGLSNTVWRASVLRGCLPLPQVVAADWFLATAAWLGGARLALDRAPLMLYRQYGDNTAKVVPPFTAVDVRAATEVVLTHQHAVAAHLAAAAGPHRAALDEARLATERFAVAIADPGLLEAYTAALDRLPPPRVWWTIVAHPELEDLWNT